MDTTLGTEDQVLDEEFVDALYPLHWLRPVLIRYATSASSSPTSGRMVREWAAEQGNGPLPAHVKISERMEESKQPVRRANGEARRTGSPRRYPASSRPDIMFFAGCTASYRAPQADQGWSHRAEPRRGNHQHPGRGRMVLHVTGPQDRPDRADPGFAEHTITHAWRRWEPSPWS